MEYNPGECRSENQLHRALFAPAAVCRLQIRDVMTATSTTSTSSQPAEQTPTPSRGIGGRIFLVLCGLGLLVWFLPAILAQLTARSDVLPWVAAELPFEAQFESASLSWLAPILLHDVQFVERETGSQARVKSLTTHQSLWNLVSDRSQPPAVDLEGFTGEIIVPRWKLTGAPVQMDYYLRALLDRSLPELPRDIDVRITSGHLKLLTPDREVLTEFPGLEAAYSFRGARSSQRAGHRITAGTTAAEAVPEKI